MRRSARGWCVVLAGLVAACSSDDGPLLTGYAALEGPRGVAAPGTIDTVLGPVPDVGLRAGRILDMAVGPDDVLYLLDRTAWTNVLAVRPGGAPEMLVGLPDERHPSRDDMS